MTDNVLTAPTEQDELRLQIEQSRVALTEKLEMLEEKVADTVQSATASVVEATASVVETVHNATASVSETVDSVNAAVQGTVENVRHTVSDTVESVRGTFDLHQQVRKHPWEMLAGAVALGYLGGRWLAPTAAPRLPVVRRSGSRLPIGRPPVAEAAGDIESEPGSGRSEEMFMDGPANSGAVTPLPWISFLTDTFGPEITKLKGLAIGTSLGMVRDLITDSAPPALRDQIVEVVNGFTEKLGGTCMPVPVVSAAKTGEVSHSRSS